MFIEKSNEKRDPSSLELESNCHCKFTLSEKQGDPISSVAVENQRDEEEEEEEEEEDQIVIRRVRSALGTPGSSDTHVTQDTPTNEDDGLFSI